MLMSPLMVLMSLVLLSLRLWPSSSSSSPSSLLVCWCVCWCVGVCVGVLVCVLVCWCVCWCVGVCVGVLVCVLVGVWMAMGSGPEAAVNSGKVLGSGGKGVG